jgi:aryl-alcohol dehydrogenase-like predicted oxidoreductase
MSVLQQDDLLEAMHRLVQAGHARIIGISAEIPVIERFFATRPGALTTAQFALNLGNIAFAQSTRANSDLLLVGNHPFGGPTGAAQGKALIAKLHTSPALPAALREKLDPNDPQTLPELVLNSVLRNTGLRSVIPAMMQTRHIDSNLKAVRQCRFTPAELTYLQQHIPTA